MSSLHVVFEATDLLLLVIHQPADTLFWWVAINKWPVLVRHQQSLKGVAAAP